MQDQQMSVIGFGNLPVQVAMGAAAAAVETSQTVDARRKLVRVFTVRAPHLAHEHAVLVVVHGPVPGLHEVHVAATDEDGLDLALVQLDELPGARDLARIAGIEEEQVLGERDDVERVLARAGLEKESPSLVDDVAVEREGRIEVEGPRSLDAMQAGHRGGTHHGFGGALAGEVFELLQLAGAFLLAQAGHDDLEQALLRDGVRWPDRAERFGARAMRQQGGQRYAKKDSTYLHFSSAGR